MNNLEKYKEHNRRMKEDPEYKKRYLQEREERLKQWWMELKPFKVSNDVPELPNPLSDFYTNRLIELGAIPKDELQNNTWYYGEYRNSDYGKWDDNNQKFHIIRSSFGQWYWDECNHFQDDDRFALFVPLRKATQQEINNELNKLK